LLLGNPAHETDANLSMLLRADALAHFASVDADAVVRLPFSGCIAGAAGKDIETSLLSAQSRSGADQTLWELDHLFASDKTIGRIGNEFKMPPGLRAVGSDFLQGLETAGQIAIKLRRTGWRFRKVK
jgi:hypothetical protein